MIDRDALIAAIHASPADDAPRLVFADWLEENGQSERAEFIRLQIAMWREHEAHGRRTPRLDAMFLEQKEIFQRPWADVLRRCGTSTVAHYSRGYATFGFHLTAATFIQEARELFGWFGPEASLALTQCHGNLEVIAAIPEIRWIHCLTLGAEWNPTPEDQITDADVEDLCQSPYLESLRILQFGGPVVHERERLPGISARACTALATARSLTRLEALTLSNHAVGDAGVAAIAGAKSLETLQVLNVDRTGLTRRGVEAILRSPYLGSLRHLRLSATGMDTRLRKQLKDRFGSGLNVVAQSSGRRRRR